MNAEIQRPYRELQVARRRAANVRNIGRFKAANPEAFAAMETRRQRTRRAQIAASRADVAPEALAEADRQHAAWLTAPVFVCHYCHGEIAPGDRTVDHVVPLSRGGKHVPTNLVPACRRCNSRKNTDSAYFA